MKITPVKLWRRQKQTKSLLGKTGQLLLWTVIRVPAKAFAPQIPYPVVIIKLDDGNKMVGQLVDYTEKDLVAGRKVVAVLRRSRIEDKEDVISYNIKFKPI